MGVFGWGWGGGGGGGGGGRGPPPPPNPPPPPATGLIYHMPSLGTMPEYLHLSDRKAMTCVSLGQISGTCMSPSKPFNICIMKVTNAYNNQEMINYYY